MWLILDIESFGPILRRFGQREAPGTGAIVWLLAILISLLLLLMLGNWTRARLRRRKAVARARDHLEKLGVEKQLTYPEQITLHRLAGVSGVQNLPLLVTSLDAFDQAVAAWMARVQQMPWLEVDEHVERLRALREKLGFRYLPPGRPPTSTRELEPDSKLYIPAGGSGGLRLLAAPTVAVDDLALYTPVFQDLRHPVHVRKQHEMWAFFWPVGGGEYRFKTRILKTVQRPEPYLLLQHGDTLISDDDAEVFACEVDLELEADHLPSTRYGRATPSLDLFREMEADVRALPVQVHTLSGSGFVASSEGTLELNDLLRVGGGDTPEFLENAVARAVKIADSGVRFRFVDLSSDARDSLLHFIAPRVSVHAFTRKTGPHASARG